MEAASVPDGPVLIVGPGAAARELAPDLPYDDLSPDGLVIETVGSNLILAGDRPRGTLYAVYTFLEDVVGCRWWSSTASTIPSIRRVRRRLGGAQQEQRQSCEARRRARRAHHLRGLRAHLQQPGTAWGAFC